MAVMMGNDLIGLIFFFLKVLDEYQKTFGESWRSIKEDVMEPWSYLNEALTKYQVSVMSPFLNN